MAYDNHMKDKIGEHWGDYEFSDHDRDQLLGDPLVDTEVLPGLSDLIETEKAGGLLMLTAGSRAHVVQQFSGTVYKKEGNYGPNTEHGTAVPAVDGLQHEWAPDAVGSGQAVIVGILSALSDKAEVILSNDAAMIANISSGDQEHYAILEAPSDLLQQASQIATQVMPEPSIEDTQEVVLPLDNTRKDSAPGVGVTALVLGAALIAAGIASRSRG